VAYSAQGTRLNRRGIETRQRTLDVAIDRLAHGGPDAASANLIARASGVTWGTIQHQFGDTDGLWAAVLEEASLRIGPVLPDLSTEPPSIHRRVTVIVESMWSAYDTPVARAVQNLRQLLPSDHTTLGESFPKTAATLRQWDERWMATWEHVFDGFETSKVKLRRVRSLLPGALRGLHVQSQLSTFTDVNEGRRGLIDAVTVYLETP